MTTDTNARRLWPALVVVLVAVVVAILAFASVHIADKALTYRGRPSAFFPVEAFDDIPLRSRDGTDLAGWWIRPGDGVRRSDLAVVVMAHDTGEERGELLHVAEPLVRAGFIVLALDLRAHGASEGSRITGGFLEADDVAAGVSLAHERALGAPVMIYGEGSGALAAARAWRRDPTVDGIGVTRAPRSYEESLLRRPEVARDPWRALAILPLVRWRMASVVGHGFRPEDGAEDMSTHRMNDDPSATEAVGFFESALERRRSANP